MRHPTTPATILLIGVLGLATAGCADRGSDDGGATRTATNGDVYNDADVDFASTAIPHHAEGLVLVDLTLGRDLSPGLAELTDEIRAVQGPAIEEMVDWLTAWEEPVPETLRDHVNAEGHGGDEAEDGPGPSGTIPERELAELEQARGADFEARWLQTMVEHHQAGIEIARDEQEDGAFGPALRLAESLESAQQQQVDAMQRLLAP